jgi:hypothetical protein
VNWDKHARKWVPHVNINGVLYHLGCFTDELEDYNVYLSALDIYNTLGILPKPNPTTSQHKGVYWRTREQKWASSIQIHKKRYALGDFTNEVDAHNAYQTALNAYSTDGTLPQKGRVAK